MQQTNKCMFILNEYTILNTSHQSHTQEREREKEKKKIPAKKANRIDMNFVWAEQCRNQITLLSDSIPMFNA